MVIAHRNLSWTVSPFLDSLICGILTRHGTNSSILGLLYNLKDMVSNYLHHTAPYWLGCTFLNFFSNWSDVFFLWFWRAKWRRLDLPHLFSDLTSLTLDWALALDILFITYSEWFYEIYLKRQVWLVSNLARTNSPDSIYTMNRIHPYIQHRYQKY